MYFFKTCWPKISQLFDFEESYLLGLGPLGSHGSSHVFVAASPPFWRPLLGIVCWSDFWRSALVFLEPFEFRVAFNPF